MCPTIEVSDSVFNELQSIAIPLVDTPNTVISRILDVYKKSVQVDKTSSPKKEASVPHRVGSDHEVLNFETDKLPDVTHTTFISGRAGTQTATDWNHLMLLAHVIAYENLGSNIDALKATSSANIKSGEVYSHGFKYIKGYPFSVQGVEANKALDIVMKLAKQFRFQVEATFRWQQKERAAYPGRTGHITFNVEN